MSLVHACKASKGPVDRRIIQVSASQHGQRSSSCRRSIDRLCAAIVGEVPSANTEHRQMKIAAATRAVGSRGLVLEPQRA